VAASAGPSSRAIARVFLTVVALAAALYLLYLVRSVVGLVADLAETPKPREMLPVSG